MGRALEEMRTQFAAFLEDPEGYDRGRLMCDRIALARACIDEIDEVEGREAERVELGVALKIVRLAVETVTKAPGSDEGQY